MFSCYCQFWNISIEKPYSSLPVLNISEIGHIYDQQFIIILLQSNQYIIINCSLTLEFIPESIFGLSCASLWVLISSCVRVLCLLPIFWLISIKLLQLRQHLLDCAQCRNATAHKHAGTHTACCTYHNEEEKNAAYNIIIEEISFFSHVVNAIFVISYCGLSLNNFEFGVITCANFAGVRESVG